MSLPGTLSRILAKSAFAFADLFQPAMPGPRILIYHQVGSRLKREMTVSTNTFRRQLDWLQQKGSIVSLEGALAHRDESNSYRLFVLTFDDGYKDMYRNAFPLLAQRGLPFTLYLTTEPTESGVPRVPGGDADPVSWDQVREMAASGLMTLGSHTHRHPDLRRLSSEAVAEELDWSNRLIEERTGIAPRHFAYPQGYWSKTADPLVRDRFDSAVLGGGPPITEATNQHRVHRVPIQRTDGLVFYRAKLNRGMRIEEALRRRLRRYEGAPR